MADITITLTDGTTTRAITIPDARTGLTADALAATLGDQAPPANDVACIHSQLRKMVNAAVRSYREVEVRRLHEAELAVKLDQVARDEDGRQ